MTRIAIFGDLAATGFGTVTMDLGRAMLAAGEDLRFISQNEIGDLPEPFKSRTWNTAEFGTWAQPKGDIRLAGFLDGCYWRDGWTAEAVIVLGDVYAVRRLVFASDETLKAFQSVPTYHYVPIEGHGLPPSFDFLWKITKPVAMSNFGADEIEKVIGYRPPVVYHGVDTVAFHPASRTSPLRSGGAFIRSKAEAKAHFKINPRTEMLLRVDSHWPRKDYGSLISALRPVIEARPDVALFMHCSYTDKFLNDDLRDHLSWYSPQARRRADVTGFHDRGFLLSREELAILYNAADVYVSTSAEGFGLTIAEAIASGVPAVGVDYSAVPEVIGPAGLVVPAEPVRNEYGHYWCHVDEGAFGDAVADLLDHKGKRERLGLAGPPHVRRNFTWQNAARQFSAIITSRAAEVAA